MTVAAPVDPTENLTDLVFANAERFADAVGFRRKVDGTWIDVTTAEFAGDVRTVACSLIAGGVRHGDRVALAGRTGYDSTVLEFALWAAGAIAVPIDADWPDEVVDKVLTDSGAATSVPEPDEADADEAVIRARRLAVRPEDPAVLHYPADGSEPVTVTHADLLTSARRLRETYPHLFRAGNSAVASAAPTQPTARAIMLACAYTRTTLGHSGDPVGLITDLGTFRPTFVLAAPSLFEQLHISARRKAHAEGLGRVYDAAEATAVDYAGATPALGTRLKRAAASKLIYPRVRAALGGRCVAAFTAGEPLDAHLARFFLGIGIPVLTDST